MYKDVQVGEHQPPQFVHKENDLSYLFSDIHGQMHRSAYQETRLQAATSDILSKWPLLAEVHGANT